MIGVVVEIMPMSSASADAGLSAGAPFASGGVPAADADCDEYCYLLLPPLTTRTVSWWTVAQSRFWQIKTASWRIGLAFAASQQMGAADDRRGQLRVRRETGME
jgi:membrane glycosyltransferase